MSWRKIIYVLLAVSAVGICLAYLFPELTQRWAHYNLDMLSRVFRRTVPFIWMHVGLACLVFALEVIAIGYKKSSFRALLHPDRSMQSDIGIFIVRAFNIDYIVIFVLTLGAMHKLNIGVDVALGLNRGLLRDLGSPVLQMIIYIVVADFLMFFEHYVHHKFSFLWPFHSYHHSAKELNVLTGNRGHPVQAEITNTIIHIIPLTILGFPLVSLLVFRLFRNALEFMNHSRLPWSWGWFGQHILVAPAYHRIHHSILPEHYDKNLAVIFPVWDHLFGTYYNGDTRPGELGLPEGQFNRKSFFDDMLVPFRMLLKREK